MSMIHSTLATRLNEAPLLPVTPISIASRKLDVILRNLEEGQPAVNVIAALRSATALIKGLDQYVVDCTSSPSEELRSLDQRTLAHDWKARFAANDTDLELEAEMLSGHVEGQLLQLLVRWGKARRILEIGMFTGYSALAMAEALPSDGHLVACEMDSYAAKFARDCFDQSPHGFKIEIVVGPAAETLNGLIEHSHTFDLIFIDADKSGYIGYLEQIMASSLLNQDGLIAIDNTLMQGQPYTQTDMTLNGTAIKQFNKWLTGHSDWHLVMIPLRDGLTLMQRRIAGKPT